VLDLTAGREVDLVALAAAPDVDDLRELHVMDRQRRNHDEATGLGSSATDLPAIELF
jgi:hypothetical protein